MIRYTSIKAILSKVRRDYTDSIDEADVIEWVGEALDAIHIRNNYEEAVAFIEVKNYEVLIPNGLANIIQIARNRCWEGPGSNGICPADVIEDAVVAVDTEEEVVESTPVPLDCYGEPITGYQLAYYRPYFDLIYEYEGWTRSAMYNRCYVPVRLAQQSFFDSIVCTEKTHDPNGLRSLYNATYEEYTIRDPYIRFNFKEGSVAISYNRTQVDDKGLPMVPDNRNVTEGIMAYVRYKMESKKFYNGEPNDKRMLKSEQDWQWYCLQAANWLMIHKTTDEWQNSLDQRSYLLPRVHRYFGYFGKMNKPEDRSWNHTRSYFRGTTDAWT